jgi:hypothetical protein
LENYGLGTGTHNEFSKIPGELPAISKSSLSPQKEIVFPARRSLITDIRAGARNSPFIFVSIHDTRGCPYRIREASVSVQDRRGCPYRIGEAIPTG